MGRPALIGPRSRACVRKARENFVEPALTATATRPSGLVFVRRTVSWLVESDVNGGRSHLNLTELDRPQRHIGDVAEQIRAGNMPPWFYLPMHPTARLTEIEKQALIEGAQKSLGPQGHQ